METSLEIIKLIIWYLDEIVLKEDETDLIRAMRIAPIRVYAQKLLESLEASVDKKEG